ncbi:MAG: ankyrin repeat domain-containing protein [Bryobacteraceae bacterium]
MRWLLSLACACVAGAATPAIVDAARSEDRAALAALVAQKADVNARDEDGATALAWAAMRGDVDIARILLAAGANPNIVNELGVGPLSLAITNGSLELVNLLVERHANPELARENGETPLMTAVRSGRVDMLKVLLAAKANANAREKHFGQTALMWAAGNPEAVRLLLSHGADAMAVTKAWDVKYVIYAPTTVTLGKTGIPWNTDGEYVTKKGGLNALFFAVQRHDIESAKMLLAAGVSVNAPSADGTTPLLAALFNWDLPGVTFVPGKGAPAQAGSSQRFTADLAMANFLLDHGATVKVTDGAGYTPLHGAVLAVASAALTKEQRRGGAYGRNASSLSLGGADNKPAHSVEEALAVVAKVLAAGADPNAQTRYPTAGPAGDVRINPAAPGSSPLHISASANSARLVKMLTDRGANPNLVRKDGHTPFSTAVLAGDLAAVKEMVAHGADIQRRYDPADKIPDPVEAITISRQNQSIMHIAALGGAKEVIEYLYSLGAPIDHKNSLGETPLALADHQERYREAIERQSAEGDVEKLKKVARKTAVSDTFKKLLASGTRGANARPAQKPAYRLAARADQ